MYFKELFGITIHHFIIRLRMEAADKLLRQNCSVLETSAHTGYRSTSHFISVFKNYYGKTPKTGNENMLNLIRSKTQLINLCIHFMVWSLLIYVLFNFPPLVGKNVKIPSQFLIKQIFHMGLMVGTYYLNTYYLVPRFLLKRRTVSFVLSIIGIMIFAGLFMARIEIWFELSAHLSKAVGKKIWQNAYVDFFGLFMTMFVLGISTSLAIMQQWNRDWKLRHELEAKRAVAELSFLKAQINPHFFFNTLNSIYALTYINAESSREVLLKLSGMMRYLLYETQHDSTTVAKELAFIRNYVEIMKHRLNENMIVDILLPQNISDSSIAPMPCYHL